MTRSQSGLLRRGRRTSDGRGGSALPPPAFDYTITTNAEWGTIPAGLLSGGGRVGVAPGTYTPKTITARPSAPLIFEAVSGLPQLRGDDPLVIGGARNITLRGLALASTAWNPSASISDAALTLTGGVENLVLDGMDLRVGYRGNPDAPIDPTATYPEYACVAATVTGGVVTALTITQPFVGDLVADGTYALDFSAAGGTGAAGTMVVSGGNIVSTNLTAGGSGYSTTLAPTSVCTFPGQRPFARWQPGGIRSATPTTIDGLRVVNCSFNGFSSALKPIGIRGTAPIEIERNLFNAIYMDNISLGMSGTAIPPPVTIRGNFITRPFSVAGKDAGDPHADGAQFFMDKTGPDVTPTDWFRIAIEGNLMVDGLARGGIQNIVLLDNAPGLAYAGVRMVANLLASNELPNTLVMEALRDAAIHRNAAIRFDPADAVRNTSAATIALPSSGGTAYGRSLAANNITEGLTAASAPLVDTTSRPNTVLGLRGATIPYASVFANHTGPRATRAEIAAAYAPKAGYEGQGPFGGGYLDVATGAVNRSLEPMFVRHENLGGQATSTLVTSEWSRVLDLGPLAGRNWTVNTGEARVADDAGGTNATAWAASGAVVPGKFMQRRLTSASTGASSTAQVLTIGTDAMTWTVTTASAASFVMIDGGGTAYSAITGPVSADVGVRRFAMACRWRPDVLTLNANFLADATASVFRLFMASATTMRLSLGTAARCSIRPAFTPTAGNLIDFLLTADFTNTNASQGVRCAINGNLLLDNTPGVGGAFDTRSVAGSGTDYGVWAPTIGQLLGTTALGVLAEGDGGGVRLDGAFGHLWLAWGNASFVLPDLTDAGVRASAFAPENIGPNGQGPLGAIPQGYWTAADLTEANSGGGIPNRGTIASRPLVRQAGTYV